jgi:hypothetical protein
VKRARRSGLNPLRNGLNFQQALVLLPPQGRGNQITQQSMKTLFITINATALLLLAAYLVMDTFFAPPQYFSARRIEILLLSCLPFTYSLIYTTKRAPKFLTAIGVIANAGFAFVMAGISVVATLNIAGIAPLIIVTAPSAGIAALNTFVLWKKFTIKRSIE